MLKEALILAALALGQTRQSEMPVRIDASSSGKGRARTIDCERKARARPLCDPQLRPALCGRHDRRQTTCHAHDRARPGVPVCVPARGLPEKNRLVQPMKIMRRVILESPFAGDIDANIAYARQCVRDCLQRGESCIASHLLFTQPGILRDEVPHERQLGIDAGLTWITVTDAMVVYIDHGISPGMQAAIEKAQHIGLAVELRSLADDGPMRRAMRLPRSGDFSESAKNATTETTQQGPDEDGTQRRSQRP
jgi:hypothetical protein